MSKEVIDERQEMADSIHTLAVVIIKKDEEIEVLESKNKVLREEVESDDWMKSATTFYENGGCPICFSTDEAGCKEGCYLGQLQRKTEKYEIAFRKIIDESGNIDQSEWPTQQQKCQAIAQQALKGGE